MKRLKVSVFAWDMGHNALGRAHVLADLLGDAYAVEIVGAHFVNTGSEIWRPHQNSTIPMRRFDGTSLPRHFSAMETIVRGLDSDVLYVSKPRLPSFALGILAKEYRNRPLILDTDDRELSFFDLREPCTLADVVGRRADEDFVKPFGRTWTQYCESLVPYADGLTVSNVALQELLGGTVIPHARDEQVFDPARYDRAELRRRMGLSPDDRAVMFAGTPRSHKGIQEIAAALAEIGDPRNKLCLFGTNEYQQVAGSLRDCEPWVRQLPYQYFNRLAETVVCADLVCILQDPASEISKYQIPAKITDALALGVPCLVRRLPSIQPLIDAGAVDVLEAGDSLVEAMTRILDDPGSATERSVERREVFLESYSYAAVRPLLEQEVARALERPSPLHPEFETLLDFHRSGFSGGVVSSQGDVAGHDAAEQAAALAHGETVRLVDGLRREIKSLDGILARRSEVEGIRQMVDALVPEGAEVAVVSKGDPALVRLGTRRARHFPATDDGAYAGYHPERSEDAISHLESLRLRGTEYFVLPKSAFWWRDQYFHFWRYLHEQCTLVRHDETVGAIFATHERS